MDDALIRVAREGLAELREALGADNLTCYFYNPFSDLYWLFATEGDFKFKGQMHGPLTHPAQRIRMNCDIEREDPHTGTVVFENSRSSDLATEVLAEESFADREQIASTIRIRVRRADSHRDDPFVVVFLNYRGSERPAQSRVNEVVGARLVWMKSCLLSLAEQPRVEEVQAWQLRGTTLKFRELLGQILVSRASAANRKEMYKYIVEKTRELAGVRQGANVLCTLCTVNNNNEVTIVESDPDGVRKAKPNAEGIVEYVARTGRIYLINNVKEYIKEPYSRSRPQYVPAQVSSKRPAVMSELACPLVIQGKVVGVLNLEADVSNAYEDDHILLLYQFASAAAIALRQIELFQDLNIALTQSQQLLSRTTEGEGIKSLRYIWNTVINATEELGYEARVWDDVHKTWDSQIELPDPRPDGYTRWVIEHNRPIVLADLRRDSVACTCRAGILGKESLFEAWEDSPGPSIAQSAEVHATVVRKASVLCYFGFPIGGSSGEKPIAVLWANCNRYFQSLLTDESWCISLFCRAASDALRVRKMLEERRGSASPSRGSVSELVRYHFGDESRGEEVLRLLETNPQALALRRAQDVIVLNVDIRNSTKFSAACGGDAELKQYKDFIGAFHELVRKHAVECGGVMDKTIGDGAQVLFNVYRPRLLNILPYDKTGEAKDGAIECAFAIAYGLRELVQSSLITTFNMDLLTLGAGLTMGTAFVGAIGNTIPGFEYSAYSFDINHAGKLVGEARAATVAEWLENARKRRWGVYSRGPDTRKSRKALAAHEVTELIERLENQGASILFADKEFQAIPKRKAYLVPRSDASGLEQVVYLLE